MNTVKSLTTQIVIPVHDLERPLRRAVDSVLRDPQAGVVVVAHNLEPRQLDLPDSDRLETVTVVGHDGRPGACFNAGVAHARAPWVGIMGSDDFFEPGATQAMRRRAEEHGADSVLAPLYTQGKRNKSRLPTVRRSNLQAARDRLFYRTAPLGIHRRELLQRSGMHFDEDVRTGEDIRVSAALWTSASSISYHWDDPAYVVTADAPTRLTRSPLHLETTGVAWARIWDEEWVAGWGTRLRHALAVKIAKVHLAGALAARPAPEHWRTGEEEWLRTYLVRLRKEDRHFDRPLDEPLRGALRALEAGAGYGSPQYRRIVAAETSRAHPAILRDALRERDSPLRWRVKDYQYEALRKVGRR